MSATYAILLDITATTTSGYLQIQPEPGIEITQAQFRFTTTGAGMSMVGVYPQEIQLQMLPSHSTSGTVTINTGATVIAGLMIVNPALDAPAKLTLHDSHGQQIGSSVTLAAGSISVNFSWAIET